MDVRAAVESELDHLARIWNDGWHDAHARITPPELRPFRTLDSFRKRLRTALSNTRVCGPSAAPHGFSIVKDAELYQLYVSTAFRGTATAAALIDDAEARIADRGYDTAWLACAVGNERAARFYEKRGWHRVATVVYEAETSAGTFPIDVWRYEKALR